MDLEKERVHGITPGLRNDYLLRTADLIIAGNFFPTVTSLPLFSCHDLI